MGRDNWSTWSGVSSATETTAEAAAEEDGGGGDDDDDDDDEGPNEQRLVVARQKRRVKCRDRWEIVMKKEEEEDVALAQQLYRAGCHIALSVSLPAPLALDSLLPPSLRLRG